MDNTITQLTSISDEFDEFDSSDAALADIAGLEELEFDTTDEEQDIIDDSSEVQGMISELIASKYIVDDNMSYFAVKSLYDRLYFANNMDRNNEFLQKCNELYDTFKSTLKGNKSYKKVTHEKTIKSYNLFVDSKDTEFNIIDQQIRSDILNVILEIPFEEIESIDTKKLIEDEYQKLLVSHGHLSVVKADVGRLRRHITRTINDAINSYLHTLTDLENPDQREDSIVKYVCPSSMDHIIKQVFTENDIYYFLDETGNRVVFDKPVINLLSCIGDAKTVICWIPQLFYSNGESYGFTSEDYMSFLNATRELFKDRSTSRSDVVDLGISINIFTQINDHILFNAPIELAESKKVEFEKYSLYVNDAEIKEACSKLRKFSKASPSSFNIEDMAKSFCAQTNNNYKMMFFQAMIGIVTFFDLNSYYKNTISLTPIMQCNCDLKYLDGISSVSLSVETNFRKMYKLHTSNEYTGIVDDEAIEALASIISDKLDAYVKRRDFVLHHVQSAIPKLRYITISKYDSCKLELFAEYLDEVSFPIFREIANYVVISSIAKDYLQGYTFQAKSYMSKNIYKSSKPDGLKSVMNNISNKLKLISAKVEYESLDCMYDISATNLIKSMHYANYSGVAVLVRQLLDSIDTVTYAAEVSVLENNFAAIQAAQSFEELPVAVVVALTSLILYIQSQSNDDYQDKIVVNTFVDYACTIDARSVTEWLKVTKSEDDFNDTDLKSFFDFQQMKYARELSDDAIGISKYIFDILFTEQLEIIDATQFYALLNSEVYKDGIREIMEASSRASSGSVTADSSTEDKMKYVKDQNIQQAILDDGGDQAVEIWLSKYLRYLGD